MSFFNLQLEQAKIKLETEQFETARLEEKLKQKRLRSEIENGEYDREETPRRKHLPKKEDVEFDNRSWLLPFHDTGFDVGEAVKKVKMQREIFEIDDDGADPPRQKKIDVIELLDSDSENDNSNMENFKAPADIIEILSDSSVEDSKLPSKKTYANQFEFEKEYFAAEDDESVSEDSAYDSDFICNAIPDSPTEVVTRNSTFAAEDDESMSEDSAYDSDFSCNTIPDSPTEVITRRSSLTHSLSRSLKAKSK